MAAKEFGVLPVTEMAGLSGLEFFQGMVAGQFPHPPMARLIGMQMVHVEHGLVRYEATAPDDAVNPAGTVHGGFSMAILDSALGCAVHSCVKAGQTVATIEVKANLTRPIPKGERLICEGKMVTLGRRVGTSEAKLVDQKGRVLAFGTSSVMISDLQGPPR